MAEGNKLRLNKVLRELNISLDRAVEHLAKKGYEVEGRPTTKISDAEYQILLDGFQTDKSKKVASKEVSEEKRKEKEAIRQQVEVEQEKKRVEEEAKKQEVLKAKAAKLELKTVGKINIETGKSLEPKVQKEEIKPVAVPIDKKVEETIEASKEKETEQKEIIVEAPKKEVNPVEDKKVEKPEKVVQPTKKVQQAKETASSSITAPTFSKKGIDKAVEQIKTDRARKTEKPKSTEQPVEVNSENAEKIKTQYKKLDGTKNYWSKN
ncbi:hypothetical protein [Tenacibaculum sp. nBUS_03]|uniref:hypothetical protein n=1 Tax=Tenacibaculum sp. nBUS_03 TaxID=3395320 RepID=UPI003EBCA1EE